MLLISAAVVLLFTYRGGRQERGVVDPHPAVAVLTRLLELRRQGSVDASSYAGFVRSDSVALELAHDASSTPGPRIPRWRRIYASAIASSSAQVVVVWREDGDFESWPRATIFQVGFERGRWLVGDATPVSGETDIPPPLETP